LIATPTRHYYFRPPITFIDPCRYCHYADISSHFISPHYYASFHMPLRFSADAIAIIDSLIIRHAIISPLPPLLPFRLYASAAADIAISSLITILIFDAISRRFRYSPAD
jgi:hypothetical protein